MSGIYIHIPFCRKACFYCDFHFSVNQKNRVDMVRCIQEEIGLRQNYLAELTPLNSIYFGGGTPSVLQLSEVEAILDTITRSIAVSLEAEVSFECNPDDLSVDYLKGLKSLGINRLSIGTQSFESDILQWMNRSHTAEQAWRSIHDAADNGFNDITIDLIYGIPQLDTRRWEDTLNKAFQLPINHLSAYSLTLEQNTPYFRLVQQKKYHQPDQDLAGDHYDILVETMAQRGWEHYEVSNFCKEGNYSRHNTAYWQNANYLGIGPGAHSYNGVERSWNISNNKKYIEAISERSLPLEVEQLTPNDKHNEYILTQLRTMWGADLKRMKEEWSSDLVADYRAEIDQWVEQGLMRVSDDRMLLTENGFLYADAISASLFR